jgi:hypothetical protein
MFRRHDVVKSYNYRLRYVIHFVNLRMDFSNIPLPTFLSSDRRLGIQLEDVVDGPASNMCLETWKFVNKLSSNC